MTSFMGPPMLVDKKAGFAIAEMPAIVLYLGETLGLMPATPALRAMTMKTVNDANDVLDDVRRGMKSRQCFCVHIRRPPSNVISSSRSLASLTVFMVIASRLG